MLIHRTSMTEIVYLICCATDTFSAVMLSGLFQKGKSSISWVSYYFDPLSLFCSFLLRQVIYSELNCNKFNKRLFLQHRKYIKWFGIYYYIRGVKHFSHIHTGFLQVTLVLIWPLRLGIYCSFFLAIFVSVKTSICYSCTNNNQY